MSVTVTSEVRLVGWHSWPDAPCGRLYLASLHRHLFRVRVEVLVRHHDREVEFHDLADDLRAFWGPEQLTRDRGSCEAMAVMLGQHINRAGYDVVSAVVGEDGESWATWTPTGGA